jgi:hypothetical protein
MRPNRLLPFARIPAGIYPRPDRATGMNGKLRQPDEMRR